MSKAEAIIIDVTEEEYLAELASGLQEDEVLKPGRHQFKRGGFLARHGIEPQRAAAVPKERLLRALVCVPCSLVSARIGISGS